MLYIVCVVAGVSLAIAMKQPGLKGLFLALRYEIYYWLIGGASLIEDAVFSSKNKIKDLPRRSNEVAVITGGTRGIGYEVIKKLLECDMHVIMGCRNGDTRCDAGHEAIRAIRATGITSGTAEIHHLDTASMASVREFAKTVMSTTDKIHLLINNAGIMAVPEAVTEDGFESHLSVNYLGHFLLTRLLLPKLKSTGSSSEKNVRIVNMSSCAHIPGKINFDDINYVNSHYIPNEAYAQSKLAQLMFSNSLDRKMRCQGARVCSYAIHPGIVNTGLFDHSPVKKYAPWFVNLFFRTAQEGSRSVVYAAMSEELEGRGGLYISNCREAWSTPYSRNIDLQNKLMDLTLKMLNLESFDDDDDDDDVGDHEK